MSKAELQAPIKKICYHFFTCFYLFLYMP